MYGTLRPLAFALVPAILLAACSGGGGDHPCAPAPLADPVAGDCHGVMTVCGGGTVEVVDDADVPADGVCTTGGCSDGTPTQSPVEPGTSCGTGQTCSAGGECLLATGQSCTGPDECVSGYCVGDVCCGGACSGACEACNGVGTGQPVGVCGAVAGCSPP